MQIAIFVSSTDAVQPGWLLRFLKGISSTQIREMRRNLAEVFTCKVYILSPSCSIITLPVSYARVTWKDKVLPMLSMLVPKEKALAFGLALISLWSQNLASFEYWSLYAFDTYFACTWGKNFRIWSSTHFTLRPKLGTFWILIFLCLC